MQNQKTMLITPPVVKLEKLKNLFFQLSSKNCNLNCKYCYLEKNSYKKEDDFLNTDKIKKTLVEVKNEKLNSIYLTGGEPLMHPDFNQILRMCLKISNVTILSNGTMINEKKARFLRRLDDESNFETIYRISLDSVDELENDSIRGRGSFRKAVFAIQCLLKYEFNPIISVVNYSNKPKQVIFQEFQEYFSKKDFELEDINLKIIPYFSSDLGVIENDFSDIDDYRVDCATSRTIAKNGVYACPMLVNDYRARLGSAISDCSNINYLDCEKCSLCMKLNQKVQVNDWM